MRTVLLLLISVAVVLPATESNPRVTRLMETFTASATAAEEAYQQAIQQAEAARAAALTTARDRTITGLKRLVNNRSGVAEQAEVYTQVLRLNREDADAVRFFTAIGTLEQVLAALEPAVETDLLGNVVGQQKRPETVVDVEPTQMVQAPPNSSFTGFASSTPTPSAPEHRLENIFDGDSNTRWQGTQMSGEWVMAAFRQPATLNKIRIHWERAHARSYTISVQVGGSWRQIVEVTNGRSGWMEHPIDIQGVSAFRVADMQAGSRWPPSIWQIVVE